jgi:hypothetical protein
MATTDRLGKITDAEDAHAENRSGHSTPLTRNWKALVFGTVSLDVHVKTTIA